MTDHDRIGDGIRRCGSADAGGMLAIINAAAEAYRGVIPADRWHDPYMAADELASDMRDGVMFSGCEADGVLVGVMGVQHRGNVDLIRHAYVSSRWQGHGIGSGLLQLLCRDAKRPVLVGTWAAADWAIRFYERHGFARVASSDMAPLLRNYWTIPDRQIEMSIVLASPPLVDGAASRLFTGMKACD